jgi:hypothetical protein
VSDVVSDPVSIPARLQQRLKAGKLEILGLEEVLERVDKAGPPTWLIEGFWPGDAYGVLGAEDKAGKTWAGVDLAVSVASGHHGSGVSPARRRDRRPCSSVRAVSATSSGASRPCARVVNSRSST